MRDAEGNIHGGYVQGRVPLGGGGFASGYDISADGTRHLCRTDVYNAYVRDATDGAWRPLFTMDSMGGPDVWDDVQATSGPHSNGVGAIRIAPSNKNRLYANFYSRLWCSDDGGRSIARINSQKIDNFSNEGPQRGFYRQIDVHPTDQDTILVGSNNDGVWWSTDGGDTLARVAGLPNCVPLLNNWYDGTTTITKNLVCIDPHNPLRCYVHVAGHGLYGSTTGVSGPFTAITGGPICSSVLFVDQIGTVWLARSWENYNNDNLTIDGSPNTHTPSEVWKYVQGTGWSHATLAIFPVTIAVDPTNANRVVATSEDMHQNLSTDGGDTWADVDFDKTTPNGSGVDRGLGEVPWIYSTPSMFVGRVMFDPNDTSIMWASEGLGVAKGSLVDAFSGPWVDHSAGIEELIGMFGCSMPGIKEPVLACQDKPFWRITDFTDYKNVFRYPVPPGGTLNLTALSLGASVDYASDDPNYLIGVCGDGLVTVSGQPYLQNGFSTDAGRSWTQFLIPSVVEGMTLGTLGSCAVNAKANIVFCTGASSPVVSRDGGDTWSLIRLGGVVPINMGFTYSKAYDRRVTADKAAGPGHFAMTVPADSWTGQAGLAGVWTTTDGWLTSTRAFAGIISEPGGPKPGHSGDQVYQHQIGYIDGKPGELLFTNYSDPTKVCDFYHSANNCQTWTAIGNVDAQTGVYDVTCFAFGAALPGQSYPSVWFVGFYNGVEGTYVSFDFFATAPVLIARYIGANVGGLQHGAGIVADKNIFGRAYVSNGGGGWVTVDYDDKGHAT